MDIEWTQCAVMYPPRNTLFSYRARPVPNTRPSGECFMIFRVYRTNLGPPSQNRNWFFRRSISLFLFSSQLRNQLVQTPAQTFSALQNFRTAMEEVIFRLKKLRFFLLGELCWGKTLCNASIPFNANEFRETVFSNELRLWLDSWVKPSLHSLVD